MEKSQHLLNQVNALLKSYEKLAKATGENFNIFSVMGMERDEVKTHSRIISELLNPKGSHNQGSIFLKCFFGEIDELRKLENFDFENAKIRVEEHIGEINKEYTIGGYIDIVIDDGKKNVIVIENKIDAPDQLGQLIRYKNHYENCKLIYLTKDGKEPSRASYYYDEKNNINLEEIILVCYKTKILNWIERCHREAIQQPMLREVLKQYSNLLKTLTNQTINNDLKMDISALIKNNFLEAAEIAKNFEEAKNQIIAEFFSDVANTFNLSEYKNNWEMIVKGTNEPFYIKKKNWDTAALAIWIKSNVIYYGVKSINNTSINCETTQLGNYRKSANSLLWNNKFKIEINKAEDVISLINDKVQKEKLVIEFIKKTMIGELEDFCEIANNEA